MLIFKNGTLGQLCLHARRAYPEECCGIIIGKRTGEGKSVYRVIPTENASKGDKTTDFLISPLEIAKAELSAEREGLEIIGFYHSHADYDAVASRADMLYMIDGYSYPIISVKNGICVKTASFEKANTEVKAEKITLQGEKQDADFGIHIGDSKDICEPKSRN